MAATEGLSQIQTSFQDPSKPVIGLPLSTQQTHLLVSNKLLPLLPYPIALLRRIQFQLNNPSPTAEIYLVLALPFSISQTTDGTTIPDLITTWLSHPSPSPPPQSHPFLSAYIDLHPAGQTQVWVFSTTEIPPDHAPPFPTSPASPSPPTSPITVAPTNPSLAPLPLLTLLLTHIHKNLIPQRASTPSPDWLWLRDNKKYLSQPYSRNKVLFGTIHSSLIPFFSVPGQTRRDGRYCKFLIPPSPSPPPPPPPPPPAASQAENDGGHATAVVSTAAGQTAYSLHPMRDADLKTVLDRSPIPRTLGTLREMPSVGLYVDTASASASCTTTTTTSPLSFTTPISTQNRTTPATTDKATETKPVCVGWGFLSKDGSISSLHVEPAHRGRGLAVVLGRRLLGMQRDVFSSSKCTSGSGTDIAHRDADADEDVDGNVRGWWGAADVEENNVSSRRVMEKLGGMVWWGVQWVEIDVPVVLKGMRKRWESGGEGVEG